LTAFIARVLQEGGAGLIARQCLPDPTGPELEAFTFCLNTYTAASVAGTTLNESALTHSAMKALQLSMASWQLPPPAAVAADALDVRPLITSPRREWTKRVGSDDDGGRSGLSNTFPPHPDA
jgi:hypothetical protein